MPELAQPAKKMAHVKEAQFDARYGYHIFLHDDIAYTPDATKQFIKDVQDFPMDHADLLIAGYPKSGTNWLNITLANLYPHWESTKITRNGQVPELTTPDRPSIGFEGFQTCARSKAPRLMKTHVPFDHTPAAFCDKGVGRAIYIRRNPKDVCDSYFNQISSWLPKDWDWDQHYEAFLNGHIFFGSWLRNVLSWRKANPEQVLHIDFEDMQREKRKTIEKIVDFVGPVKSETINEVMEKTDFQAMQRNSLSTQYQPQMLRRKGQSGGWRQRFTATQSARLDALFAPSLKAARIEIDYGD